jgi:hypothetical protein
MLFLKQILPSALLALGVAVAIAGAALFCRGERVRAAVTCFALGVGYAAGHFLIAGLTRLPPTDTTNWLPYLGVAAAIIGAAGVVIRRPSVRWLLLGLVSASGLRLLLGPIFRNTWTAGTAWLFLACLAAATVLLGVTLQALRRSASYKFDAPLCLLIISVGSFGALILSGSLLLAQFVLVLTGAIAGVSIIQLRGNVGDCSAVVALLLVALLASGYFFADLKAPAAALLAGAPLVALLPNRIGRSSVRFGVRLVLVSVPVIAALILAFRSSPSLDY